MWFNILFWSVRTPTNKRSIAFYFSLVQFLHMTCIITLYFFNGFYLFRGGFKNIFPDQPVHAFCIRWCGERTFIIIVCSLFIFRYAGKQVFQFYSSRLQGCFFVLLPRNSI